MPELTPEEKQKIYEEEKVRLATQEKASSDKGKKKKGVGCITILFSLIIVGAVGYFELKREGYISSPRKSATRPSKTATSPSQTSKYPAPVSSPFQVKVNKFRVGEYGYYEVIGEITNTGTKPYQFVELKAQYYNDKNEVVGEETTYACANDFILPGGKKSFKFMGENQSDYKTVRVNVVDAMQVR